ncbi:GIY-YIG nuclease family protein [Kitasatospora sp. NPDC048239]|uniref:GIY-YIG nuclease family protein n=1 Tax=Kitasatospora sp. NPDC048239 TaxID=3364046 RepID=UPI003715E88F
MAARNAAFWNGPTGLYRLYDGNGLLLYVGLSTAPERRFREHRKATPWWRDVDRSRTTVEWLQCGGNDAIAVEREVIRAELPAANIEWVAPLPDGCPERLPLETWFDREAQYLAWRRWFVVWRDCRLQAGELVARESAGVR